MAANMTDLMRNLAAVNAARTDTSGGRAYVSRVAPAGTGFGLIPDEARTHLVYTVRPADLTKVRLGGHLLIVKAAKSAKPGTGRKLRHQLTR